jgi:hypothetical protein
MTENNQLINLIAGFTSSGTPLQATVGSKSEWMVTILTAAMLANENLASSMTAEESERIEYLKQALFPGTMFEALRVSDTDWFEKTYSELGAVAAYCDGYWE